MRTFAAVASVLACSSLVAAAPLAKRQTPDIDYTILQYALTLEHLEATFYREGLNNYDASAFEQAGYEPWVRRRLTEIASHEKTHVDFLETALKGAGQTPTAACTYNFGVKDPKSMLAVAQILEGVGVAAYLGAAANITSPAYLTAAGSILTTEARHNAWIRSAANKGDAFPAAFDNYLQFSEVYSLAAEFITECPSSNPTLPVTKFPSLTLDTTGTIKPGQTIKLSYANSTSSDYVVFITGAGQTAVQYSSDGVTVPKGQYGQNYAVISKSQMASDDTVIAGPAIIEVPLSPSEDIDYN